MRSWWALLGLLLLDCKSGTRTTDTRSNGIKSKELKLAFLQDYVGSPTEVEDVEFHIVVHDNSGGLLSGPSDSDFQVSANFAIGSLAIRSTCRFSCSVSEKPLRSALRSTPTINASSAGRARGFVSRPPSLPSF